MIQPWPLLSTQHLFETHVFSVRKDRVRSPRHGNEMEMFVLETRDWINVIPTTDDGKVVLVRQWRHGTRSESLEIPGGMMDAGDADALGAAVRELREETGYEAAAWTQIGSVEPNPAIQNNACHTFLAEGARRVRDQDLDHGEDIEVVEVPLSDIPGLIDAGTIRHSLVVAAFYHLERRRLLLASQRRLEELARHQRREIARLADRLDPRLTADDLLSPDDFPVLRDDPDFQYANGMLAGMLAALAALKAKG
jgi:8-oxo-dGTP pyrophosphatase MutT (NUDIX family)